MAGDVPQRAALAGLMVMVAAVQTRRMALAAVLLVVLGFAGWVAGNRFIADAVRADARFYVDRWQAGKLKLDNARLDELITQLTHAAARDPGNPRIALELAVLLYSHPENRRLLDPKARARLVDARDRNAHAAAARPTWELAWGNLAASRYILGQLDAEFFAALEQALRYGPWNQSVQMLAIRIGLIAWPLLPPPLQAQLRDAIHRQAHWRLSPQANVLRTPITAFGRTELLCLLEPPPKGCTP